MYVCICVQISSYVYLYDELEVYGVCEAGVFVVFSDVCTKYRRKARLFLIH